MGTELDIMTVKQAREFHKALGRRLADASPLVMRKRMVKDPEEIVYVERACDAAHMGHEAAVARLPDDVRGDAFPGQAELHAAGLVERT